MLKFLLYRHFVAPEIWHLSSDKPVLQTRIECIDSPSCSRESNIQSEDHVMQMDKIYLHVTLHLQELRQEHMDICLCKGVRED